MLVTFIWKLWRQVPGVEVHCCQCLSCIASYPCAVSEAFKFQFAPRFGGPSGMEKNETHDISESTLLETRRKHLKLDLDPQNDMAPVDINNELSLVAASIQRCAAGMSRWDMAELTLGLYKLFQCHALAGAIDTIPGSQVEDIEELEEMRYWLKWAMAAYEMNRSSIAELLQINKLQIKKHVGTAAVLRPSYYIAVDNLKCCLVVAIRGTQSTTDILTDLNPHSEKFEAGYAHSGMLAAAKWLMEEEYENLQILLKAYPGYKFVLTGHSLGAGTASLLCMLLHKSFSKNGVKQVARFDVHASMVTCWGFGCPPCVDNELAQQLAHIKNIVLQDDVIARLSPAALEDLRSEISEIDWVCTLPDDSKMKKTMELVRRTHRILTDIEAGLGYEQGHFYKQIKSYGYASIAAAKDVTMACLREYQQDTDGSKLQTVLNWLSYGASSIKQCVDMFSASGTNTRQARVKEAGTILADNTRLYVPGILYHVKNGRRSVGKKPENGENDAMQRYAVTRGDNPEVRFKRLVLSTSMLSDHTCQSYRKALDGAIQCASPSASSY